MYVLIVVINRCHRFMDNFCVYIIILTCNMYFIIKILNNLKKYFVKHKGSTISRMIKCRLHRNIYNISKCLLSPPPTLDCRNLYTICPKYCFLYCSVEIITFSLIFLQYINTIIKQRKSYLS